ncbi:O-antigen ligase family protein [Thiomicrorhabdus lithotrophica]|uniref:O-antigen ligase family protein n=1 Tax=Thiomicrorhabdus lithotrophica TaxID=2949997 RepID=A0ABY8C831_9GAMM|nr:O-antigen ligase family protein [Thiomicrorhabdus lithotrophica]WEJ62124.1 O-antigen ligase family protein [Thiomicrorhabdus lithotrophica]
MLTGIKVMLNYRAFPVLVFLLLLFFLPSMVYEKYFAKGYIHLVLLVGFGFVLYNNQKQVIFNKDEEKLIRFGFMIFVIALIGFFQQTPGLTRFDAIIDNYLKALLPLALIPLFYFTKLNGLKLLVGSLLIASLVALGLSLYGEYQNMPRGGGTAHGSAIIFGDLAMLFTLLSGLFGFYFFKTKQYLLSIVLMISCLLSLFSSVFSGTKGGLIALLSLPFVVAPVIQDRKARIIFISIILFLLGIVISMIFGTENLLKDRIIRGWTEMLQILNGNFDGPSLGLRVQIWMVAWQAFLSSPILGIGIGEFYAFKLNLINSDMASVDIQFYKHAHNEYFTILSSMGLVGVVLYIWFFKWLLGYFYQHAISSSYEIKFLGIAGLITIMCYIDFSLSESFLSSHLGGGTFFFVTSLLIFTINKNKNI